MTRWHRSKAWFLALGFITACSGAPSGGGATTVPATSTGPTTTTTPVTSTGPTTATIPETTGSSSPSQAETIDVGPGGFVAFDYTIGLDDLSSYRAALTISFTGTENGQPQEWAVTSVLQHAQNPLATQVIVETTGSGAPESPTQIWELGGVVFETGPSQDCEATVSQEDSARDQFEPASSLPAVIGAEMAGTEAIDGVDADHYTFDERALGLSGLTHSVGNLWVAADGTHLLQYTLTTEGDAGYFGDGVEGVISWDYRLTEIDPSFPTPVPASCPAGLIDAPLLPDADDVVTLPGLLRYHTTTGVADVVDFYRTAGIERGWTLAGEPLVVGDQGFLEGENAQGRFVVLVRAEAGASEVIITVTRGG